MKKTISYILILSSLVLFSCNRENDDDTDTTAVTEDQVESITDGSNAVASALDEVTGGDFASYQPDPLEFLNVISTAYASSCTRVGNLSCSSGVRSRTLDCSYGIRRPRTLTGDMTLTYSDSTCSMANVNDSVTRTFSRNISFTNSGRSMQVTTSSSSDYRGNTYGGTGNVLTRTADGYTLKINGRHRTATNASGTQILSISTRSLEDLVITGGLDRASRRIESGTVEVNHNLAEFTSTFAASALAYESGCCHPVSGSFTVTYTDTNGTQLSTSTVNFGSCGTASVSTNGEEAQSIELDDEQCD